MQKEEIYNEIEQKMDELLGICLDNNIPMFATFAKEDSEKGKTDYISRVATPLAANVSLSEDKITQFNAALAHDFYLKIKGTEESLEDIGSLFEDALSEED